MKVLALEIRDRATFIPALAIQLKADNLSQAFLVHWRAGYPTDGSMIVLIKLSDGKGATNPYSWQSQRTMGNAHMYILKNFNNLIDGDVIDVQYILGETSEIKRSEKFDYLEECKKDE